MIFERFTYFTKLEILPNHSVKVCVLFEPLVIFDLNHGRSFGDVRFQNHSVTLRTIHENNTLFKKSREQIIFSFFFFTAAATMAHIFETTL